MVKGFGTSEAVCVECSMRDDCLRCYAFCRHSKNPIFNRDMRVFNRLPIYIGEDLIDKVNREAVLKDILMFDKNKLKSVEYATTYNYNDGRYSSERIHFTHHWISKKYYPTGYWWIQKDNSLDEYLNTNWGLHATASRHIENYYRDTKQAKKLFRKWYKSIAHKRIIDKFNMDMDKLYGDGVDRENFPLYKDCKYWMKQTFTDYNPVRNNHSRLRDVVKGRIKYVYNGNKVASCRKLQEEYFNEVDETRRNQYERYKRLFKSTKDLNEALWYLMKMGMVCYNYKTSYERQISKDYFWMGSLNSHIRYVNDGASFNQRNRCDCYDLQLLIYRLMTEDNYTFNHHNIDPYDFQYQFEDFINTDIKLPKINEMKQYYKKVVMPDLILSFKTKPQRWLYSIRGYIKRDMSCVVCFNDDTMDSHQWIKCGTCDTLVCGDCFKKIEKCPMCRLEY